MLDHMPKLALSVKLSSAIWFDVVTSGFEAHPGGGEPASSHKAPVGFTRGMALLLTSF